MARRGENIYYRKDGRYEGRYIKERDGQGKIKWGYVYGRQYQEVKEKLILHKAEQAKAGKTADSRKECERLDTWLVYWLEVLTRPYVKESTYYSYKRNIEKYLIPCLGEKQLNTLKREEIQHFVITLSDRLQPGTIQNILRNLSAALKEACMRSLISVNPCQKIRVPPNPGISPRYLTREEQAGLEEVFVREGDFIYLLCLYTGLRLGEVCALMWKDVDFQGQSISVGRTVQRIAEEGPWGKTRLVLQTPKSAAGYREIPVPGFIMEGLEGWFLQNCGREEDYVFQHSPGKPPEPRAVQKRLQRIAEKQNIARVHMHTLRHTYATRCLEQGIGYETLSSLMGHSSPRITLQYYAHCTRENKRRSVEKLVPIYNQPGKKAV